MRTRSESGAKAGRKRTRGPSGRATRIMLSREKAKGSRPDKLTDHRLNTVVLLANGWNHIARKQRQFASLAAPQRNTSKLCKDLSRELKNTSTVDNWPHLQRDLDRPPLDQVATLTLSYCCFSQAEVMDVFTPPPATINMLAKMITKIITLQQNTVPPTIIPDINNYWPPCQNQKARKLS